MSQRAVNMKTIILLFVTISLAYADASTTSPGSTETSNKSESKTPNSIAAPPAKTQYYSSASRAPTYVQLVQKPYFAHPHQGLPHAMLIIAQPGYLPHNLVYNQPSNVQAQQLLNYFHSNPSAKYQLLYGAQPQHQPQSQHQNQQSQHQPIYYATAAQAQSFGGGGHQSQNANNYHQHYQYLTPLANFVQAQPIALTHPHYTQSAQYVAPQYTQIPASTYSQQASPSHSQFTSGKSSLQAYQTQQITQPIAPSKSQAQLSPHFYSQGPQTFTPQTPIKTAAPIITGLENFTPEQQAQIKEQLSSHFGSITQINSNSLQANPNGDFTAKFSIETQSGEATQADSGNLKPEARNEQPQAQAQVQQQPNHHYASAQSSSSGFTPTSFTYRTPQYTKG